MFSKKHKDIFNNISNVKLATYVGIGLHIRKHKPTRTYVRVSSSAISCYKVYPILHQVPLDFAPGFAILSSPL